MLQAKSWEDTAYIIMWKSEKSGGTYTEVRRTDKGRDNFLATLRYIGVPAENIRVVREPKPFVPDRIAKRVSK